LALALLPVPLLFSRAWRVIVGFWVAMSALRLAQLARQHQRFTATEQVLLVALLFDPREQARRGRPTPPLQLVLGLPLLAATVVLFVLARAEAQPWLRWGEGTLAVLLGASGLDRALRGALSLGGIHYPPQHRAPLGSRTLGEFWGRRWNRLVGGWLRDELFRPLAHRGSPKLAAGVTFVVSALLHVYPIWLSAGARWAALMGGFFVLHGGLYLLEHQLRVRRWPAASGRLFVWGCFFLTLPLFVEPLLQGLDGGGPPPRTAVQGHGEGQARPPGRRGP
jgi:hypothetical protein